jgi:cysteine desulfurase/selenocysteine lyase
MREEQTPLPDGVPPPELIGRLASEAYRAAPAGEPGDSLKAAFDGLADPCPGPSPLRDLMRASGSSNGAATSEKRAISTLPASSPQWETQAYYFLAGSAFETQTREVGGGALPGVRGDFPALHQTVNGKPLVWLDNAATTHKPQAVIDAVARFYAHDNSNVHRGAHALAKRATDAYEGARKTVAAFIGAPSPEQIVWVRGATEAINLVAQSFGRRFVGPGDDVLVTTLEHHSNIVPWQMLCEATGAALRIIPISDDGELLVGEYARMLSSRTKIVAVTQVSNVLGTVVPIHEVTGMAHAVGAKVVVDGAQAVQHMPVNVTVLDADFYAFSGHKLFGPTGIGVLYGKRDLLEEMPPWQGGGSMIDRVTFEKTTYAGLPAKFEAGTGHLAGAPGLASAIEYVTALGLEKIAAQEQRLMSRGREALSAVPGLRHLSHAPGAVSMLSFVIPGVDAERIGAFLDREGVAVRAGHHCAQPLLRRLGLTAAVRASAALYNTLDEMDALAAALQRGVRTSWE